MPLHVTARVALVSLFALGAAACGGAVAGGGASSDGGPGQDSGLPDVIGTQLDSGNGIPPGYDGGPITTDSGPPPSGDTCATPGVQCVTPPTAPTGPTNAPSPTAQQFAVHTLYMGDTDRTGVTSYQAWESFGYNLDNLVTTKSSTDVCTLAVGASKTTQIDGVGGIDNSFGENILPILITTAGSSFSTTLNDSIQAGTFTMLFYTVGFDDTPGSTATTSGLTGALLGGGDYATVNGGAAPAFNATTHWPILPGTLNGCPNQVCPPGTNPVNAAMTQFPAAYQQTGTWVSGLSSSAFTLTLGLGGQPLPLVIHDGVVTFAPSSTTTGAVTNGTIAGVLETTELINSFKSVAGNISMSLCSGSAFDSIAQQLTQASDIILNTTTGAVSNTAGISCNAISIGLGFDALEVALPGSSDIAGPTPPTPDPCGDAGQ